MKKILIIGATGFVGRHLIGQLSKLKKYEISCLVRKTSNPSHPKNFTLTYGDITNINDLIKASKNKDIIINLAVPNTQNEEINRKIIIEGAENVIEAAKKNKVSKVIALSSFAGYRKTLDNYGKAKKEADKIYQNSGLNLILIRPTMIYGRGGYAFEKLLTSITKIPFFVPIVGNGKNKIQPAFIGDVINAITASIEYEKNGTFDVGGPIPIGYDDFVNLIQKTLGNRKILIHIPLNLLIGLAKILKIFAKNAAWNELTFKRMVEEVQLDIQKTEKNLGIRLTNYEEALKKI